MQIHFDKTSNMVYKKMDNIYYYGELLRYTPSYDDYFLPRTLQQRYKVRWKSHDPLSYEHDDFYTETDKENWLNYIGSELSGIISFLERMNQISVLNQVKHKTST